MTVHIRNHNNIYVQIDTTRDIMSEMSGYFEFYAENYRFHPMFKQKRWDGRIRLLNINTGLIYRGLLDRVIEFCTDRNYEFKLDKTLIQDEKIELSEVQKFVDSLGFTSKGNKINPYDYQVEGIWHCLNNKRALVQSPTSSGKSVFIAGIARYLQTKFNPELKKILIIVPNVSLVNQFAYDFCDYFSTDVDWLKSDPVHTIHAGKDKDTTCPIVISTYQSLMKLPKEYFQQYGCVIVDECHGAESKVLTKLINLCTNAEYRFGFTGSLKKSQIHVLSLEGMFGKTHTTITTRELMDNDQVTELEIKALVIKYPDEYCDKLRKINDYQTEVDLTVANEKRNKFIAKLAISQPGNGLILVNLVEKHAKPLLKTIQDMVGDDRPVYYVSGEVKGSVREEIRQKLDTENNAIIVASYATFSTGLNVPSLKWLIFGSSSKSMTRVVQSIGRIIRKHKSKSVVTLFDIVDDCRIKLRKNTHENYLFKHFVERLEIYRDQKFPCEIKKVPLFVKES